MATSAVAPIIEEGLGKEGEVFFKTALWNSTKTWLKGLGSAGESIAKKLDAGTAAADKTSAVLGQEVDKIFKSVPEADHAHIEDVAFGKTAPKSMAHAKAGQDLRAMLDTYTGAARTQGETMPLIAGAKKRIPIQLTSDGVHFYKKEIFDAGSKERDQALKHLMSTGGYSQNEAIKYLDQLKGQALGRRSLGHMYNPGYTLPHDLLADAQTRYTFWARAMGRTLGQNQVFGSKYEFLIPEVKAIVSDKGLVTGNAVADALDVYFHQTYPAGYRTAKGLEGVAQKAYYQSTNQMERTAKTIAGYIMTRHIALPHLGQIWNAGLVTDVQSLVKATLMRMGSSKGAAIDEVLRSGAAESETFSSILNHYYGRDTLFNKMFHQPLFSFERKIFTDISALAGKIHAQELTEDLLKNPTDKATIEKLIKLGLKPEDIIKRGALASEDINTAMYTTAKEAMFKRDATQTPFRWEGGPGSRTVMLYRHFMFNQSRLVYNAFKQAYREEGAVGVAKTSAYFLTVYPATGMFVQAAENLMMGRPAGDTDIKPFEDHEYVDFYLNALAHAYSFGIAWGVMKAARRHGMLSNGVGPIFSKTADFAQDLFSFGYDSITGKKSVGDAFRPVRKDITTSLPGGAFVERALDDKLFEEN